MSRRGRKGFTLVEAAISTTILTMILGTFVVLSYRFVGAKEQIEDSYTLEMAILDAMDDIRRDLRRSGYSTAAGNFPAVFDDAEVGGTFSAFRHAAVHAHPDGELTNRDMVFLMPDDDDGDGWPDYDADAEPVWDDAEYAYILIPDNDGTNILRRITSDGRSTDVAQKVMRAIFDTSASAGYTIPLECVRVTLELGEYEGTNLSASVSRTMVVRLRNKGN